MDKKDSHTSNLSQKQIEELRRKNPDIVIPDKNLRIESFNKQLDKAIDKPMPTIKEVKKLLNIKDADIAEMFDFKNVLSYRNSSAKPRIEKGIIALYLLITKKER